MYDRTQGRVVVGHGMSEEFQVNIYLRQEVRNLAFYCPVYVMVIELISRKINTKDVLGKMLHANDLALVAAIESN